MLIILELELNGIAIDTACCIDLIDRQLSAVLYSCSIYGGMLRTEVEDGTWMLYARVPLTHQT